MIKSITIRGTVRIRFMQSRTISKRSHPGIRVKKLHAEKSDRSEKGLRIQKILL